MRRRWCKPSRCSMMSALWGVALSGDLRTPRRGFWRALLEGRGPGESDDRDQNHGRDQARTEVFRGYSLPVFSPHWRYPTPSSQGRWQALLKIDVVVDDHRATGCSDTGELRQAPGIADREVTRRRGVVGRGRHGLLLILERPKRMIRTGPLLLSHG